MRMLLIETGKFRGKRIPLSRPIILIGRDLEADIRLNSNLVSRRHCQLTVVGDEITVKDLDSQNGTFINDHPVHEPTKLKLGDRLRLAATVFVFQDAAMIDGPLSSGFARPVHEPISANDSAVGEWLNQGEPVPPGKINLQDTAEIPVPDFSGAGAKIDPGEISTVSVSSPKGRSSAATSQPKKQPASPADDPQVVKAAAAIIRRRWNHGRTPPAS